MSREPRFCHFLFVKKFPSPPLFLFDVAPFKKLAAMHCNCPHLYLSTYRYSFWSDPNPPHFGPQCTQLCLLQATRPRGVWPNVWPRMRPRVCKMKISSGNNPLFLIQRRGLCFPLVLEGTNRLGCIPNKQTNKQTQFNS